MEYPFKDLLPLDEVLEREGYYKDWTHLDPEVFYSLTQISEYIKTKGYGADVRLLIAQLADHFSLKTKQINQIELFFKDVMRELAEDKDFHSLPEISGARGGFDTLGDRLDETTTQLARKVDKGNVSVSDINKNLGKFDQTFMSEEFLQQMAGNTPIGTVPADGSITALKLADKSVNAEKTQFLNVEKSKNLFDKKDVLLGVLYALDDTKSENELFYSTDFNILLKPNSFYVINKARHVGLKKEDGTSLSSAEFVRRKLDGTMWTSKNTGDNNATVIVETPNFYTWLGISGRIDNLDTTQIEIGKLPTSFQPYYYRLVMPELMLTENQKNSILPENLTLVKSGENCSIHSTLSGGEKIEIKTKRYGSNNGSFTYDGTYIDGEFVHATFDDITPMRTSYAVVGANHGYTTHVNTVAHTKTSSDLGSVWTDGTNTYTLLAIESGKLTFLIRGQMVNGEYVVNVVSPKTSLTHVSGASNTGTIDLGTLSTGQLFPSINNTKIKYELDGKEIQGDGEFSGMSLSITETYEILSYKSIHETMNNAIGRLFNPNTIGSLATFTVVYQFGKHANSVVSHSVKLKEKCELGLLGFMQSQPLYKGANKVRRYVPNAKVKLGVDLSVLTDIDDITSTLTFGITDLIDNTKPISRYADWIYKNDNKFVGFTMGYLPDMLDATPDKRLINTENFFNIRSDSKKAYPYAFNNTLAQPGDYFSVIAYRNYLSPSYKNIDTTVELNNGTYYIIDYANYSPEGIELPKNNIGEKYEIIEDSGITFLTDTVDAYGIPFRANAKGYAIIKV